MTKRRDPVARIHPPIDRVMDHRLLYLKERPEEAVPSFLLSLFTFTYLPPGRSGHVAFIRDLRAGIAAMTVADDLEIGERALLRHAPSAFAEVFRADGVRPGTFRPGALYGGDPWVIDGPGIAVEARWLDLTTPILATGPSPGRPDEVDIFSVLFEARRADVTLNGAPVVGAPYQDGMWMPWLGRPLSSCVVAVGEVLVTREPEGRSSGGR